MSPEFFVNSHNMLGVNEARVVPFMTGPIRVEPKKKKKKIDLVKESFYFRGIVNKR